MSGLLGTFYAAFTAGLHEPVKKLAEKQDLKIIALLDGALIYEAEHPLYLPCFVNVYAVIKLRRCEECTENGAAVLSRFMKAAAAKPGPVNAVLTGIGNACEKAGFRIIVSVENQLVSADANVKARLEHAISKRTGLAPDRGGNGQEFWLLYRREGFLLFMYRLTHHTAYEKTLRKGELRPELAYMLNVLSEPKDGDTVLDPFCGSGAVPAARFTHFPCGALYASDISSEMTGIAREKLEKAGAVVQGPDTLQDNRAVVSHTRPDDRSNTLVKSACYAEVFNADITAAGFNLPPGSITKIVTDPPWGVYDAALDIKQLYECFLRKGLTLIVPGGKMVVLVSRKTPLRELLPRSEFSTFILENVYDILVSGKKASIYVIKRSGG